jgi:predicted RNase H-like nuclease
MNPQTRHPCRAALASIPSAKRKVYVAGVDGCRGGWVVALARVASGRPAVEALRLCESFADVLALRERPKVIAVDMPIGLLDRPRRGGRDCDRLARKLLGDRAASVFSPPIRPALPAMTGRRADYARARRLNGGLSLQSFYVGTKVREVDSLLTPSHQKRVFEAHPELAFRRLARAPLRGGKKTAGGRRLRARLLTSRFVRLPDMRGFRDRHGRATVATDDVLDALVLCLTARRILAGAAERLPPIAPRDRKGLRMEIRY